MPVSPSPSDTPSPGASPAVHAPSPADSLAAEARVLLHARAELARNPGKALTLAEEREVLRIEALVRLGRLDEAATLGAAFRARHPRSPHVPRVQRLLRDAMR